MADYSIPGIPAGERSLAPSVVVGGDGATEQRTVIQAYEFEGKDAVGGTMTQTQEVEEEPEYAQPKLLPVPKRATDTPAPTVPKRAPATSAPDSGAAGAVKAAKGSANMRRSIVALERTWENRMCGVLLYLVVSGLVALFTSLDFFTLIGVVPGRPSISYVVTAATNYFDYIDNASAVLAKELYEVYNRSAVEQQEDCFQKETFSGAEASRLPNDTSNFVEGYCKNLGIRIFNYSIVTFGPPYVSKIYGCSESKIATSTPAVLNSSNLLWIVNSTYVQCTDPTLTDGRCYWQLFYSTPNPNCTDSFDRNYSPDRYRSDGFTICKDFVDTELRVFYENYDSRNEFTSFWAALENLMTYNENYLAKMIPNIELLGDLNINLDVKIRALQLKFQEFNLKINYQHDWMFNARGFLLDLRRYVPVANIPSIDLTTPSIPDFDLIDLNIGDIDLDLDLFNDYNPPDIVGISVNITNYQIPEYTPTFQNNFTLASSGLYQDVLNIFEFLKGRVDDIAQLDLIVRFLMWLREFGFLIRVVKRDMTTLRAKVKRYLALIFQNAIILLYVGIFIYASAAFLRFDGINFNFALAELNVQCENAVYIKNLEKLGKYQGTMFVKRADCNSALSTRNNITTSINEKLITPIVEMAETYESLYHAVNLGTTQAPNNARVVDFQLPVVDFGSSLYGSTVEEQGPTEIETYTVQTDDCNNSPEAKALTDALNRVTAEIRYYISGVLLITIALIATSRLTSMGLQYFFWMETTRGYAFDTPFTSDTVRARIKARKRNAVIMWILAVGFLIFVVCYGRVYLKKKIPSAYT